MDKKAPSPRDALGLDEKPTPIDGPPAMGVNEHPFDPPIPDQAMPLRFWLGLIIFIGIALRVIVLVLGPAWDTERAAGPETPRDLFLVQAMIAGKGLSHPHPIDATVAPELARHDRLLLNIQLTGARDTAAELNHMPGYPVVLALLDLLKVPMAALLVAQVALSGLLMGLCFGLTRRLLDSEKAGLVAAAVVAVHPWAIVAATGLGAQVLFACMVVGGLWVVTATWARPWSAAVGGGMLMGLATLVKPLGLAVGPIAALCVLMREPRKGRAVALAGLILVASLAPAALWVLRNEARSGERVLTRQGTLHEYSHTAGALAPELAGVNPAQALLNERQGEESLYATMARVTRGRIAEQPEEYALLAGRRLATRVGDHGVDRLYQQLGLTWRPTGLRTSVLGHDAPIWLPHGWGDRATHGLGATWMTINLLLAGLAIAGFAGLLVRRRWTALLTLAALALWLALAWPLPAESGRLALIAVQAAVVGTLILPAPQRVKKPKRKRKLKDRWMSDDAEDEAPRTPKLLEQPTMRPL